MTTDEVARQMIKAHIEQCRADREDLHKLFEQIWTAVDDIRKERMRMMKATIGFLMFACVSMIAYIWKNAIIQILSVG